MTAKTERKPWGAGRIAFIARLDQIRAEISQGVPLTTIHDRHKEALGIGYASFCKLVTRYADDAKLTPVARQRMPRTRRPEPARPEPAAVPALPPPSEPLATGKPAHAGSGHGRPRTFDFDGTPRQDDKARLIGGPHAQRKG